MAFISGASDQNNVEQDEVQIIDGIKDESTAENVATNTASIGGVDGNNQY